MAALLPEARRNWTWRTFAVGVAYAVTLIAFVAANKLTTAANAIFLQATAPLYLLALGPLVLREKIGQADIAVFGAIAAGVMLPALGFARLRIGPRTSNRRHHRDLLRLFLGVDDYRIALARQARSRRQRRDFNRDCGQFNRIRGVPAGGIADKRGCAKRRIGRALSGCFSGSSGLCVSDTLHPPRARFRSSHPALVEPIFNPAWTWLSGEKPASRVLAGGALIVLAAFGGTLWQARRELVRQT